MSTLPTMPPPSIYEGILKTINTERLTLVKGDHQLVSDGWVLHFVIDPYDISEFCFPFSPENLADQFGLDNIDKLSKLQNGRYEALYSHTTRPILLEAYAEELEHIKEWIDWSRFVPTEVDLLDRYLDILSIQPAANAKELRNTLHDLTERDIGSLLAVVTGMVAIGSKRFNELYCERLVRRENVKPYDGRASSHHDDFEVNKIFNVLQQNFYRSLSPEVRDDQEKWAQRSKQMIDRSNRRDARAVYQVLQLNKRENKNKQLFLYLSSVPKSAHLLKAAPMRGEWPVIEGRPFYLVRDAADLFAYMVWKGESVDPRNSAKEAVAKLNELEELIEEIEAIRNAFTSASDNCEMCHNRGQSKCEFAVYCDNVRKYGQDIASRKNNNIQWSLERRLAEVLEEVRNSAPSAGRGKYSILLDTLSDLISKKKPTAKGQEMEVALTKARFVATLVRPPRLQRHPDISCHLNYYPVRLRLVDRKLAAIIADVTSILPVSKWDNDKFNACVNDYLDVDFGRANDEQSELLRCFLYLVMQTLENSARIALKFLAVDNPGKERIRQEFRYLGSYALWQQLKFAQASSLAEEGIQHDVKDARFHHILSMILFTMARSDEELWVRVISAAEQARSLFAKKKDREMEAACCNNLAYFLSRPESVEFNAESEKHLQRLIELIPESEWKPMYPEFFHSKACVLLAQFREAARNGNIEAHLFRESYLYATRAYELDRDKPQHFQLLKILERVANEYSLKPV